MISCEVNFTYYATFQLKKYKQQNVSFLWFLFYQNTALFSTFFRPSVRLSVCHGCDIEIFLNDLMV